MVPMLKTLSAVPVDILNHVFGPDASESLSTQQDNLVFIGLNQNNIDIYQGQNTKDTIQIDAHQTNCQIFVKRGASQVASNATTPTLIIWSSCDYNAHHISIAEHAVLKCIWIIADVDPLVKPRDDSNMSPRGFTTGSSLQNETDGVTRTVTIQTRGTFHDHQVFAPRISTKIKSTIRLENEYAQSISSGCLLSESGECSYEPIQEHFGFHTKSFLNFRVVLAKRAQSSFRGLVVLHKNAQKSEAYQENKNLLLSRTARADSEPRLEIIPNDVLCKHGSATAELDKKQLYYLMSRGFSTHQAKEMIVQSFCHSEESIATQVINHILHTRKGILNS